MSELFEGDLMQQKVKEIQTHLTSQEMDLFLDLKNRCVQRGAEFYLDKKFFPFPEEQEDFFEFLLKEGILQRLGASENGVGGYVWKLQISTFDHLRLMLCGQETEKRPDVTHVHELAVDAFFEHLDYFEIEYLSRIPELWMSQGVFSQLDIEKNLPNSNLSIRQKKTIFQSLINLGVAERSPNPNIILISRVQYFALWSKIFGIDKISSPDQFVGFEQNEGIIFQSLSCFFETYVNRQASGKMTREYFPQFMKTQVKNKYH